MLYPTFLVLGSVFKSGGVRTYHVQDLQRMVKRMATPGVWVDPLPEAVDVDSRSYSTETKSVQIFSLLFLNSHLTDNTKFLKPGI